MVSPRHFVAIAPDVASLSKPLMSLNRPKQTEMGPIVLAKCELFIRCQEWSYLDGILRIKPSRIRTPRPNMPAEMLREDFFSRPRNFVLADSGPPPVIPARRAVPPVSFICPLHSTI